MFNKESNYIRRTAGPKYSNYVSDGFGRDRYIIFNNGGLMSRESYRSSERTSRKYYDIPFYKRPDSVERNDKINWKDSALENKKNNELKLMNNKLLLFRESKSKSQLSNDFELQKNNKLYFVTKKELMAMKKVRKIESQLTQRLYYSQVPKVKSEVLVFSKTNSNRFPYDKPILISNLQFKSCQSVNCLGKSLGKN